jgi:hypothetical protein
MVLPLPSPDANTSNQKVAVNFPLRLVPGSNNSPAYLSNVDQCASKASAHPVTRKIERPPRLSHRIPMEHCDGPLLAENGRPIATHRIDSQAVKPYT